MAEAVGSCPRGRKPGNRPLRSVAGEWAGESPVLGLERGAGGEVRAVRERGDTRRRAGAHGWPEMVAQQMPSTLDHPLEEQISGHRSPDGPILPAPHWYVSHLLSYVNAVERPSQRGVVADRTTIYRWVKRFLPLFHEAACDHRRPVVQSGERTRRTAT